MPIYEYRCGKCGQFEIMQKITERPLRRCPTCQGKVTKLISNSSFHLKGSGWYATDYARKGESKSSAKESAPAKTETKSETTAKSEKSESKPTKSTDSAAA